MGFPSGKGRRQVRLKSAALRSGLQTVLCLSVCEALVNRATYSSGTSAGAKKKKVMEADTNNERTGARKATPPPFVFGGETHH